MMSAPAQIRSLDWITRLVALDTTSHLSNMRLINEVADECRRLGLDPQIFPTDDGSKANLVVTVPDVHGGRTGGVVISGHTDTVPVTGQDWTSDPFTVRVDEHKLTGRGVTDMKSYLAVALAFLPDFVRAPLAVPLHLAFTYDEEPGCLGGEQIIPQIAELGLNPAIALIGEPTSMEVVTFHKSANRARVIFTGVPAHSSLTPAGVNAVEYAADLVRYLRDIAQDWREHGPFDPDYVVPYSTLSVNTINGGTAGNIIAGRCELSFEFRTIEGVDPQEVMARIRVEAGRLGALMSAQNPAAGVHVEVLAHVPGLANHGTQAAALARAAGARGAGPKVTYGTEAGQFLAAGIDALVCGPGDIAQAHTADEWISVEQVSACEDYFAALLAHLVKQ